MIHRDFEICLQEDTHKKYKGYRITFASSQESNSMELI